MHLFYIASTLVLLAFQFSFASQWAITTFTTREGLPSNSIHAIYQTRDKYLWFGTEEGLVRFNGYTFTVFNKRTQPYIESNFFNNIFQDRNGTLWVGTEGGGCYILDGDTLRKYSFSNAEQPKNIYNFQEDSSGGFWIVSDFNKIYYYHQGAWTYFTKDSGLPNEYVSTASVDENGIFLFGSSYKMIHEFENGAFKRIALPPQLTQLNDKRAGIDLIRRTKDGTLTLSVGTVGIVTIKGNSISVKSRKNGLPSDRIRNWYFGSAGRVIMGTFDAGLIVQDRNSIEQYLEANGFPSNDVLSVYEDIEGNIWAGTRGGIVRLSKTFVETLAERRNVRRPIVWSVSQDAKGDLWLGTHGQGVMKYINGELVSVPAFTYDVTVYSILAARDGSLWIGTEKSGVIRYRNGVKKQFDRRNGLSFHAVTCLLESRDGTVWVGTDNGVNRIVNDRVSKLEEDTLIMKQIIRCLYEDAQGNIWIGTEGNGVYRYTGKNVLRYTTAQGLSDDFVFAVHQDADGVFWLGTVNGGLNRFDGKTFTHYTMANGLFDDAVFTILEDERNNFWISCNNGIYTVPRQQLNDVAFGKREHVQCISFGVSDGMRTEECNGGISPAACILRDGRMAFATAIGVAVIDPKKVIGEAEIPRLTIERVRGNDKQFALFDNSVTLPPDVFHAEFDYAGLTFTSPERVRYRYTLAGFDDFWIEAGTRRIAYYTNVPPGSYKFIVESSDARGIWNRENRATMSVTVLAPYYKTWWFRVSLALALAGIGVWLYRFRIDQLLRVERVRGRIATDLHDDIGTNLTRIALFSDVVKRELDRNRGNSEKAQSLAAEIGETARGVIDSMNDIVWTVDPRNDAFDNVTLRMKNYASKILSVKGIDHIITIDPALEEIRLPIDFRRNIFLIFKESLNNIIKHAEASHVEIALKRDKGILRMTIYDNGKGISASRTGTGHGLKNLHDRAALIKGTCTIETAPPHGTAITLKVDIP